MTHERYISDDSAWLIGDDIGLIAATHKKVTWALIEQRSGYTRAALAKNSIVRKAYDEAKAELKKGYSTAERLKAAEDEITKLNAKNDRLKQTLLGYRQLYLRWSYNAINLCIEPEKLDQPIPLSLKTGMRRRDSIQVAK